MFRKTALKCLNLRPIKPVFYKFRALNTVVDEKKNLLEDRSTDLATFQVPEPPKILDDVEYETALKTTHDSLAHFGLDSYWPAGWVRYGLQELHAGAGLPWWECIVAGVVVGRLLVLPFTFKNMRSAHKTKGHQNALAEMTARMNQARKAGDYVTMQMTQYEMMAYQKKSGISATSLLTNSAPQMVLFVSYFLAVKRMASAPLESMKEGGILWFVDLTSADPTWLLSACCSTSLFFALKTGLDMPMDFGGQTFKTIFRIGLPTVVFFTTHYFPSAVLVYWTTSNCFSLLLSLILRNQSVRRKLKLPPRQSAKKEKVNVGDIVNFDEDGNPIRKKKFILVVKDKCSDLYQKFRVRKDAVPMDHDLRHRDHVNFRKAGQGPLIPTYSYNPKEKFKEAFDNRKKEHENRFGKLGQFWGKIFG